MLAIAWPGTPRSPRHRNGDDPRPRFRETAVLADECFALGGRVARTDASVHRRLSKGATEPARLGLCVGNAAQGMRPTSGELRFVPALQIAHLTRQVGDCYSFPRATHQWECPS